MKKAKGNCSHKPGVPVFIAGKNPFATQDCDSANIRTHEPITIEGACTLTSCLLDCIHYLNTGRKEQSYRLQRTLEDRQSSERKRLGSYYYPYHDANKTLFFRGVIDSDMHLLAEMLGVHIYEYRTDLSLPKWSYIAGNKHGKNGSEAIYLQYWMQHQGVHKGEGHVALITGICPKTSKSYPKSPFTFTFHIITYIHLIFIFLFNFDQLGYPLCTCFESFNSCKSLLRIFTSLWDVRN